MIIKKLELQGFKSFPTRTKIVFHEGITTIIGPNGTGKSNIVDALLWVLRGKRSKTYRGDRSGDAIFNGNSKKAPLSMADVNLVLTDEKEDLTINHRIYRSGESEYRLNGKLARLKDIQDTLWKKSISEADYFVIEQGSIGVFLSSKPLEKRQLLEEAAGTAFYKDKKKQAQNKLVNSEQNLTRLEDIIAEVEKAKNSLKRQAQAAVRYRNLREEIRSYTLLLYRKRMDQIENGQTEAIKAYQKSLESENAKLLIIKDEEKKLADLRKEIWGLEQSLKEKQESLYIHQSQLSRKEAEKERQEKRVIDLEERKKAVQITNEEFKQEILAIKKEEVELENLMGELKKELSLKQKQLASEKEKNRNTQEQLEELQKKIESFRDNYFQNLSTQTEVKNETAKVEKELEMILRQLGKLNDRLTQEKTLFRNKKETNDQIAAEVSENKQQLEEQKKAVETTQKALEQTHQNITVLKDQIAELRNKRDKDIHHLHALEKLKIKESDAKAEAAFPESLGILADLIESDAKHAPLIDSVWKEEARAFLIPVEDFIENLQEKNIINNFLLLKEEKAQKSQHPYPSDPEILGFLKSHIRADEKTKKFLDPLKEAAVVQELKTAVRLWLRYPDINFVTLKGDFLHSSGLLLPGQKREGIITLNQEINSLKKRLSSLERELLPLEQKLEDKLAEETRLAGQVQQQSALALQLERKIEEKENTQKFIQSEMNKAEANISILQKELYTINREKNTLDEKYKSLSSRAAQLETKVISFKNDLNEKENSFNLFREKIDQTQRDFFELKSSVEIASEKLNNMESQKISLKSRQESLKVKIKAIENEINNAEKEQEALRSSAELLQKNIKQQEETDKEKKAQIAQEDKRLKTLYKEQEETEQQLQSMREGYEAIKEERVQKEVHKAELERDIVNFEESCWNELKKTLQEVKKEVPLETVPKEDIKQKIETLNEKLQRIKAVNLMAEEEYQIQQNRYDFLIKQKGDLRESIDSTREAIKKIDKESKAQFMKAIEEVNKNFQDIFALLFEGGQAEIKLTAPDEPLESGVEIIAQPPGKKVQSLNLLSGGERTLTSLAFFFALFRYKPTPFCILDEVDAALDQANLTRFLNLMKKIKTMTQFILITHNFKTMEVADYIYGTTMAEPNITSIYSVKMEKKETKHKT